MKKLLSLVLVLMIVVGLTSVGAITASAITANDVTSWAQHVVNAGRSLDNGQCVGLVNAYLTNFWGFTTRGRGIEYAKQLYGATFWPSGWMKVPRGNPAKAGDIIVWSDAGAGHTGVVVSDGHTFTTVEQNIAGAQYPKYLTRTSTHAELLGYVRPPLESANRDPVSALDALSGGAGTIHLAGWAFDPDSLGASLDLHVYVGGPAGSGAHAYVLPYAAHKERKDVNQAHGCGTNHGFDETIYVTETGSKAIYVYAINPQGGNNPLVGSKTVTISSMPTSVNIENGWYSIRSKHSGKNIDSTGSSAEDVRVHIWDVMNANAYQHWYFERQSDGTYKIENRSSKMVLEVYRGGKGIRESVTQHSWNGSNAQRWYIFGAGTGYYKFVNKNSGYVMDIVNAATSNGTQVQQYYNSGSGAQGFALTRQDFAITYNANGGSGAPAAQTKWRDVTLKLSSTKPTRSGYTFLGWSTSKTATSPTYLAGGNYTANAAATLYAVWKSDVPKVISTVTYDYAENGGTGVDVIVSPTAMNPSYQRKTDGAHTLELEEGAVVQIAKVRLGLMGSTMDYHYKGYKEGWEFIGWNTDPDATVGLSSLAMSDSDVTLYAIYKKTITGAFVDAVGSQSASGTLYNKESAVATTPPAQRAYAGWTAAGWSAETEPSVAAASEFMLTENAEPYYGLYERDVTLNFNTDGGNAIASQTAKQKVNSYDLSIVHDPSFILPVAPVRDGYAFNGWQAPNGDVFVEGQSITLSASATMKAVWDAKMYLVMYNANGGDNAPASQTKTHDGGALTLSAEQPTRAGYTFLGWSDSADETTAQYQPGDTYAANIGITLYAVWKPITYSIKYNANGGTGTMANSAHTFDIEAALSANTFSKTGYAFAGWAFDPAETEPVYADKANVINLTIADGTVIELYAIWTNNAPATYTVTVTNGTGGGSFAAGAVVTISAGTPPAGQRFKNWTVNSGGVTLANAHSATTTFTMPVKAVSVTANFEAIPANTYAVTITNGTGGGSFAAGTVVTITAGTPPAGQRFKNWTVNSGGVMLANANSATTTFTMPAKAVSVTANFEAIPASTYTVTVNNGNANKSTATAGETITVTANAAPNGKVFDKWTTSDGVSFANARSTTTTFTMPSKNVTVTATYKNAPKGIFGTNAKWYGEWWHYLLFFICFGWIWMWF